MIPTEQGVQGVWGVEGQVLITFLHEKVDHCWEPELLAVVRRKDPRHSLRLKKFDLRGDDDPSAAAENLYVARPSLCEELDQILEVLDVAALIRADGNTLHVLLHTGCYNLFNRTVMAEMDDLDALTLQDSSHDVDGGVVSIKQ